jgi:hypothetical protein
MKQFSYFCVWALILGCQGVTAGFAGDSEIGSALLENNKSVESPSSQSVRSSTQFQNVEGTLKEIQGNVYVVNGKATQQPIRVEIGRAGPDATGFDFYQRWACVDYSLTGNRER